MAIEGDAAREPGVLLVHTGGRPASRAVSVSARPIDVGRSAACALPVDDPSLAGRHLSITWRDGVWQVTARSAGEGCHVDGVRLDDTIARPGLRVVRAGRTVLLLCTDIRCHRDSPVTGEGVIAGPRFAAALEAASVAARTGDPLHLAGEPGAGKAVVARAYHQAAATKGPLVRVEGATIRARADLVELLRAARGGTVLVDEPEAMDAGTRTTLLHAHTSREVRLCTASRSPGSLAPVLVVPPLRDRPEEISWLLAQEVATVAPALRPHARLVETALGRPWPGNVRELRAAAASAARAALTDGGPWVDVDHLDAQAGRAAGHASTPTARPTELPVARALRRRLAPRRSR